MRPISDILTLAATIVAAVVIGFGVPLLWVWIGSQLQGPSGATSLNFSVAVAILFGIIATYIGVLYVAGWVMTRVDPSIKESKQRSTSRSPWMRGTTDTRAVGGKREGMTAIERVFVVTVMIVTGAAWVWFLFFAEGGGLPNQ